MSKHIGVLLSGCGAWDGSDIHETVLTLLALDRAGIKAICTAPNVPHQHILNHMTQEAHTTPRNVLTESARLARGDIIDLATFDISQLDALIIPGGSGAVKNLSPFALRGPTGEVNPQVRQLITTMQAHKKPIGAFAMAAIPLITSLARQKIEVAVSDDPGIVAAVEFLGARHHQCRPGEIYVDNKHHIVTTPISGADTGVATIAQGVYRLVAKVIDLTG